MYAGHELLTFYREDTTVKHLKPYADLIFHSPLYPVITDASGVVLSVPPVINSRHSRITLGTRNVLIEVTATDATKANIVLETIVTMFSQYCAQPFTVEEVDIQYDSPSPSASASASEEGAAAAAVPEAVRAYTSPALSTRQCSATVAEITGTIGVLISPAQICTLCDRMQLGPAQYLPASDAVLVHVPPTRSDILHAVDIIEDVAIAYGFNNIPLTTPATLTVGAQLPMNSFADLLRAEVARAGYMEMLTHGLCSEAENFAHLRRPVGPAVRLSNPANVEYEVVRTTLLPGALKTLAHNRSLLPGHTSLLSVISFYV